MSIEPVEPARGAPDATEVSRGSAYEASGPRAVQDFYGDDYAHCYGCGRLNPEGRHLRSYAVGDGVVASVTPGRNDNSFPGFAYGGYLASLLDCHSIAAAAAAWHRAGGRTLGFEEVEPFVTESLKVDFVRPTPLEGLLFLEARAVRVEGRKVAVEAQLSVEGAVCVRAEVLAVRMPETMRPHGAG